MAVTRSRSTGRAGADETDTSGYNPYLQARYEGQLLKQMAASFTACAGASVTLGSADGYTFRLETETASCPEGRTDCTLAHTKTQLVCEENGQVHPLGAPLLDGAWWLIDINAPKAASAIWNRICTQDAFQAAATGSI